MTSFPKVTVVIPSLNVVPYIKKCMDSVLNQTLSDIEVLVVDANSSDGTHEIIKEYEHNDNRVRLLEDDRHSTGYAKNLGIKEARAPFIAIVESDDYIEATMFEKLYKKAMETGADIVKANYSTFIEKDGEDIIFPKSVSNYDDYNTVINPWESQTCFSWVMNEWLGIYKKSFLEEFKIRHNESKGASFQDTGFWFLTFAYARKIVLISDHLYYYRKDNPFASVSQSDKVWEICNEYDYIERELSSNSKLWNHVKAPFFRSFFHDNMAVFFRISDSKKRKLLTKVREKLLLAKDKGYLDRSLYSDDEWFQLNDLLISDTVFYENYINEKNKKEIRKTEFLSSLGERPIIIFGAGSYGNNLLYFLQSNKIEVTAFADNDYKKWNKLANGKHIYSVDKCRLVCPEAVYLIAHKSKGKEIRDDLLKKGLLEDDVKVCVLEDYIDKLI